MITSSNLRSVILFVIAILVASSGTQSLAQSYDSALLDRARLAADMIPGDRPLEVRFQGISEWSAPLSDYIEDASDEPVEWIVGVFQIRFQGSWIMVDAGAEENSAGSEVFSNAEYAAYQRAFEEATSIVITHEHVDHAVSLVRGRLSEKVAKSVWLTFEQRKTMLNAEADSMIAKMTAEQAERFPVVGYKELLPIAPGVVLIKAPGHTRGSQIVFVGLDGGEELLLVGDVVWHQSQIANTSQKSSGWDFLGEDRLALETQVEWLKTVSDSEIHLVIAHDLTALEVQVGEGIITKGLYLPTPD